jgi:hypothetical protein
MDGSPKDSVFSKFSITVSKGGQKLTLFQYTVGKNYFMLLMFYLKENYA